MFRFIIKRASLIIPTFLGVTFLSFMLIRLVPGDPIEVRVGERGISPERLAELRHEYGLDQPLWKQFLDYEGDVVTGNLGVSVVTKETVWNEFTTLFPATLELALAAIVFATAIGLPLGVIAAVRRGSPLDYGLMGVSVTGASMPIFWWGLMLILIFSVNSSSVGTSTRAERSPSATRPTASMTSPTGAASRRNDRAARPKPRSTMRRATPRAIFPGRSGAPSALASVQKRNVAATTERTAAATKNMAMRRTKRS